MLDSTCIRDCRLVVRYVVNDLFPRGQGSFELNLDRVAPPLRTLSCSLVFCARTTCMLLNSLVCLYHSCSVSCICIVHMPTPSVRSRGRKRPIRRLTVWIKTSFLRLSFLPIDSWQESPRTTDFLLTYSFGDPRRHVGALDLSHHVPFLTVAVALPRTARTRLIVADHPLGAH